MDNSHDSNKPVAWCSQCGHKCPQAVNQEPVGWWDAKLGFFEEKHFDQLRPLYTTPPAAQPAPMQDGGVGGCAMCGAAYEDQIIKATLSAFGPDEGVTFAQDTWAKLHQAMSAVVAQQAPVPLTDDQMWKIWNSFGVDEMNQQEAVAFARSIEAAHGIGKGQP
jgi:hypothetical protein